MSIETASQHSLVGLQLFPYDIVDEGIDNVLEGASHSAATVLLPALTYVREQQPVPSGQLPHNPVRRTHQTDGGVYFSPDLGRYPDKLVPRVSDDASGAYRAVEMLNAKAVDRGIKVVPWLSLLNGRIAEAAEACVVNARGDNVVGWLCPRRPENIAYVQALVSDIVEQFEPSAIFIDRFRYPEWGPRGAVDACACFCDICQREAIDSGIDVAAARTLLLEVLKVLETDPACASNAALNTAASSLRAVSWFAQRIPLLEWLVFRQEAIEQITRAAKDAAGGAEIWLDVWPPSYGWLLGQDLRRLAPYGSWTKPFTYHRLAGGANIANLIAGLAFDEVTREEFYSAFLAFFGFSGPSRFRDFASEGLDPKFVTSEIDLARQLAADRSKVAAGVQIWQVGSEGVRSALDHALAARPDGYIFYCYGWATLEELTAAGDWLREKGLAR